MFGLERAPVELADCPRRVYRLPGVHLRSPVLGVGLGCRIWLRRPEGALRADWKDPWPALRNRKWGWRAARRRSRRLVRRPRPGQLGRREPWRRTKPLSGELPDPRRAIGGRTPEARASRPARPRALASSGPPRQ